MSVSYMTAHDVAVLSEVKLRAFASRVALRGRTIAFRYWDDTTAAMQDRGTYDAILLTLDGQHPGDADNEPAAAAWLGGILEREGDLPVAPGDLFHYEGYPARVEEVFPRETFPIDTGIARARFRLGASVGGAG